MDFKLEQAIEILSQTPATLKSLLGNLSDDWVFAAAGEKDWSPFDIIGHLIYAEETDWIPRAEIILKQDDNPFFEPFDRFGHIEKVKGKTLTELLDEFAEIREKNIEILKAWNLTDDQLNLRGVHPELGSVALEQLLATWCVHDLTHIRQTATVIAKQYTEAVGHWKENLSILQ